MKIINFGSLNIDHVYEVAHFVKPGETLQSSKYSRFGGGKGSNQSIALAHAGAEVWHAGKTGSDGIWLKERLEQYGVDTSLITICDTPTGHAIIQVTPEGENSIVLYGGANMEIGTDEIAGTFNAGEPGDFLLVQNEISSLPEIIREASEMDLVTVFNAAPFGPEIEEYPLHLISYFIVNEIEGAGLTGEDQPGKILDSMRERFPGAGTLLTLGADGAMYGDNEKRLKVLAVKTDPVDTTAAGDTFTGYFLAEMTRDSGMEKCLEIASAAAAICITRKGAADSIPLRSEVTGF